MLDVEPKEKPVEAAAGVAVGLLAPNVGFDPFLSSLLEAPNAKVVPVLLLVLGFGSGGADAVEAPNEKAVLFSVFESLCGGADEDGAPNENPPTFVSEEDAAAGAAGFDPNENALALVFAPSLFSFSPFDEAAYPNENPAPELVLVFVPSLFF